MFFRNILRRYYYCSAFRECHVLSVQPAYTTDLHQAHRTDGLIASDITRSEHIQLRPGTRFSSRAKTGLLVTRGFNSWQRWIFLRYGQQGWAKMDLPVRTFWDPAGIMWGLLHCARHLKERAVKFLCASYAHPVRNVGRSCRLPLQDPPMTPCAHPMRNVS